ncbi:DUF500-domain-containing protein [Lophiostoma macrostomum CBS 122681]|uniref:DUF500-domain-containing protein n=1 Tax=Lophiostoma macrostomum CBS 122681 TaxID=1314788 RepID=A0A6A6TRX0_9PLEO|nr:DUF500-domain-containing protein [Lophiostoma macrostomum CBS 122681]
MSNFPLFTENSGPRTQPLAPLQRSSMWSKTKTNSKAGFDKLYGWVDKLGAPVNRLSNKLGSEAFWPTTLDKESDKAARILKSFCSELFLLGSRNQDGFYQEEDRPSADGPKAKQKVLKKIPAEVIQNAQGLAIFTTMRTGLWVSGAGGSGILIARKEDGTWSAPSGILLHTAGLGFLVGVDIYDCVIVINSRKALEAFTKIRCTLGGEISATAGPVGMGGVLETEVHKRQAPVFTYLKSRGFYAGVQVDGTIIIERTDENERFYGERIGVADILAGKVRHEPYETRMLHETIKSAQGDSDVDSALLPSEPPPGDYMVEDGDDKTFGIPDQEDPDPFGVLALENAGLEIREAGTHKRPTSEQFEFKPSPTSPIYTTFRRSLDHSSFDGRSISRRSSWRTSTMSSVLGSKSNTMVDMSTQTDFDAPPAIHVPPALPPRSTQSTSPIMTEIPEGESTDDVKTPQKGKGTDDIKTPKEEKRGSTELADGFEDVSLVGDADDEVVYEEPVIQEVHQAAAPQAITRARIVTVAKPIAPKLPPRNPFRGGRLSVNSDVGHDNSTRDMGAGPSPMVGPSSPSTPSLKNDGSTVSSQESLSSIEGLEHVSHQLQPNTSQEQEKKEEDFHSVPDSPVKAIPGGFN